METILSGIIIGAAIFVLATQVGKVAEALETLVAVIEEKDND
jgi:hypothetical protein